MGVDETDVYGVLEVERPDTCHKVNGPLKQVVPRLIYSGTINCSTGITYSRVRDRGPLK